MFKTHVVHAVSSFTTKSLSVSVTEIMKTADWLGVLLVCLRLDALPQSQLGLGHWEPHA